MNKLKKMKEQRTFKEIYEAERDSKHPGAVFIERVAEATMKTESAVRMTHLPTGLVAVCQDERSQSRNREKCLRTLEARSLDFRRREEEAKIGADRLTLRGSGDRSDKIRTYNFPQNRMTDHRIGLTLYSLDRIVEGEMAPLLDALRENDLDERIRLALAETR